MRVVLVLAVMACSSKSEPPPPSGSVPAGTILDAADDVGAPITLRIDAIETDPKDPDIQLYTVSVRDRSNAWVNYCKPDRYGVAKAVMLSGSWDPHGDFHAGSRVTIACTSGPLGKCVRWGYKPWKQRTDGASLADYHQACIRMTRADYCGDGHAHTVDGTWIDLYDKLGIQVPEPKPDREVVLEAGWTPFGASYINVARWTDDIASIVAECPQKLSGRTGEQLSREEILRRYPATLLFNNHAAKLEDRKRP